ncbi:hypothetical protein [Pseudoxanthomonas sp. PXM02]|uniref:hypothetical protein n=1 Tax=Pseudoxanthomonas sp. PXM02 TaxID=2769294 RepID=UPI00177BA090|nr:hypothetical protein [Pseudoxanthomonas sp. PXM02]MBD9480790.1 hypothetical protein [Pseudoxanthomonas sp. PXM02]
MKPIEVFVLFGSGYLCGLSTTSGFILQGLKKIFANRWNKRLEATWIAAWAFHAIVCSLMTVLLIALAVVGDQPGRPDYWPRFTVYALGVLGGMAFVFLSAHLVNIGARNWRERA